MKIAVIIPVHNRRETTLNYLMQMQGMRVDDVCLDIIVVDDASPDGTAKIVEALADQDKRIHLLSRPSNRHIKGKIGGAQCTHSF